MAPVPTYFANLLDFVQNDVPFVVTNLKKCFKRKLLFSCSFFTHPSPTFRVLNFLQLRISPSNCGSIFFGENFWLKIMRIFSSQSLPSLPRRPPVSLPFVFPLASQLEQSCNVLFNEIVESLSKFEDGILVDHVFAVWARPIIYSQPRGRDIC